MPALPDSLKPILLQMNFGARTAVDGQNRVHVLVKRSSKSAEPFKGLSPIQHNLFVYPKPTAPVVGWFFEILDNPRHPLQEVVYFNVLDQDQARDLKLLVPQKSVPFYLVAAETFEVLTTKEIPSPSNTRIGLNEARDLASGIPVDQYDFNRAKMDFLGDHSLAQIAGLLSDFPAHAKTCGQCRENFAVVFPVMRKVLDLEGPEE